MNEYVKQIASGAIYQFCGYLLASGDYHEAALVDKLDTFLRDNNIDTNYPAVSTWEKVIIDNVIEKNINDYRLEQLSVYKVPIDYSSVTYNKLYVATESKFVSLDCIINTDDGRWKWFHVGYGNTMQEAINELVIKKLEMIALPLNVCYNGIHQ